MDPGTAGILVAEGAALAAVLAAYSLGREPSAATPDKSAVPPPEAPAAAAAAPAAPGSAAATVTVPDSTEDPTIEADPTVSAAKAALQAKKDEYDLAKITREKTLNTEMNAEFPPLGRDPAEATATYNERKSRAEEAKKLWVAEKRHGFMLQDRSFTAEIATLQKDLDTKRAAAVKAKSEATADEKAKATATNIPKQPEGALPADTLKFNAAAAVAASEAEGKPGAERAPGFPRPSEVETREFKAAVELAMANKFENLQPAIDLADKTPSLLAATYDDDPFLVYFMKKLIHAAVQNKLRWRVNVITDRRAAKEAAREKAVKSTGRGRIRTPRRIRGGAWTTEVRALILKTLNLLKDRGEANPKELTPIMTAFLLLVADYGESNLDIYNNLVDIFTTFIDYKGYADRWRTYLLRMNSPDRKLVANVMFATALEVPTVGELNPYFFWARSGLQNSWGDAVAAKPFTIDPAKLTERKKVTTQGPENMKTEALNPGAQTVLTNIKDAAEAAEAAEKAGQAAEAAKGAERAASQAAFDAETAVAAAPTEAAAAAAREEGRQALAAAQAQAAMDQAAALAAAQAQAATDQAAAVAETEARVRQAAAADQATAVAEAEARVRQEAAATAAAAAAAQAAREEAERLNSELSEKLSNLRTQIADANTRIEGIRLANLRPEEKAREAALVSPSRLLTFSSQTSLNGAPPLSGALPREDEVLAVNSLAPVSTAAQSPTLDLFADLDKKAEKISDTSPLKNAAKRILARAKSALSNPNQYTQGVLTRALNEARRKLQRAPPLPARSSARLREKRAQLESDALGLNTDLVGTVPQQTADDMRRRDSIASISSVLVGLLEGMKLTEGEGNAFDSVMAGTTEEDKQLFAEIYETFTNTTSEAEGEAVTWAPGTDRPSLAGVTGNAGAVSTAARVFKRGLLGGGRRRSHRRRHKKRKARTSTFRRNRKH